MSLKGWIANHVDPDMHVQSENLATLQALMPCPLLGVLPWQNIKPESPELYKLNKSVLNILKFV